MVAELAVFLLTLKSLIKMTKMSKSVRVTPSEQRNEDILSVLQEANVTVTSDCFCVESLNGGTNSMFSVQIGDEKRMSWCLSRSAKKIIFRIFGEQTEILIDRNREVENMKLLASQGLGANIVAEFENGIAYEYIEGRTISQSDLLSGEIWPLIARKLAKFHKISSDNNTQNILWTRIQSWIDLASEFDDYKFGVFKDKKELQEELRFLKNMLNDCHSPVVFCHLDLNIPNILYDGEDVHFIDVEYAGPTYAAFDIANHFVQFVGIEDDPLDWARWYPDKDYQLNWIRTYLEAMAAPCSEAEVEALYILVQRFVLCAHLQWGAWNIFQASVSSLELDFGGWASQCFKEYARMKAIVLK